MVMSATDSHGGVKAADLDACQRVLRAFRTAQPQQTVGDGEPFDLVFAISCDIHIYFYKYVYTIYVYIYI